MKKIFLLLLGTVLFLCGAASAAFAAANPPPLLAEAAQNLSVELNRLDDGLSRAAQKLGKSGLTGPEAREALSALCSKFSYAVDCAAVDLQGTMVTLEPAPFRRFEGKNIAGQEQVQRILKTGQPVLSGVFRAVEGFPAIDAEYPVATPDGKRLGSVSLLFKPEKFLGGVLDGLVAGTPVNIWVMDKHGMILYDVDKPQIGLNLFSDPLYRSYDSLLRLGRQIAGTSAGSGIYEFIGQSQRRTVRKKTYWRTVSLYGTDWRLVAVQVEHPDEKMKTGIVLPAVSLQQKLALHSAAPALVRSLSGGDEKTAMKLFQDLYDSTPGLYSVQWMDERGINRFGYPRENSLRDYNYAAGRRTDDRELLRILHAKKADTYELQLLEGRTGVLTFQPVFDGQRYLGMLYTIHLKN